MVNRTTKIYFFIQKSKMKFKIIKHLHNFLKNKKLNTLYIISYPGAILYYLFFPFKFKVFYLLSMWGDVSGHSLYLTLLALGLTESTSYFILGNVHNETIDKMEKNNVEYILNYEESEDEGSEDEEEVVEEVEEVNTDDKTQVFSLDKPVVTEVLDEAGESESEFQREAENKDSPDELSSKESDEETEKEDDVSGEDEEKAKKQKMIRVAIALLAVGYFFFFDKKEEEIGRAHV